MNEEEIFFENNKKQKLFGILFKPDKEDFPVVIYCHGYRSSLRSSKVRPIAEKLNAKGIGLFAFDFSGRGKSDGEFVDTTLTQYMSDLKSAIDYFGKNVGVIGNSLGGIVSLQLTAKDERIKALGLISPVSVFPWKQKEEFSSEGLKEWKEKGTTTTYNKKGEPFVIGYQFYEDGLQYGDCSVYNNIKVPVFIIQGDEDTSISLESVKKLVENLQDSKLIVVKGADHNYTKPEDYDKMVEETSNFFIEHETYE